ncbi:MAG TPA: glycosyltransferase [Candidatus Binatia bacterium]|jgi:glycosyltransferase involved in cell wall biosynthesis|nr:glycosyltransferase [Candidatus Binatia bacterium]
MKVALVHDWLTGMRGGEKCLEVFCELFPDADLYTLVSNPDGISPTIKRMNVKTSWIDRLPGSQNYFRYLLPIFPRAIESFELGDYDLVLSSSHCVAKGIFPHRALHISYVHAPMRYVWDQHDAYFGSDASSIARVGMALWRRYLQQWDVRSSERVNFFVANSNNVAAKIKRLYGREAAVIHPPVDVERFRLCERQEPYYLIVSALVPYKKIDIAIDAFNRLKLPLKIAGEGPLRKKLEKMAQPNIEFLGWLSDEALASLYAACQALIFPGEEDFGIVPLEAQASGRPVIAYGNGGALETVLPLDGNELTRPTGIVFHELTTESLMAAVCTFQENRHRFEATAIRQHACRFSRDRFKVQIRDYIAARLREHAAEN